MPTKPELREMDVLASALYDFLEANTKSSGTFDLNVRMTRRSDSVGNFPFVAIDAATLSESVPIAVTISSASDDKKLIAFSTVLNVSLDLEFFEDICVTAAEGGINYWAEGLPHDLPAPGFKIIEQEISSGNERKTFEITPAWIQIGVGRLLQGKMCHSRITTSLYQALIENDGGLIDAEVADAIVQAACFNDLVYG